MTSCTTKTCTKCAKTFPATLEFFQQDKRKYYIQTNRFKLVARCKTCLYQEKMAYKLSNPGREHYSEAKMRAKKRGIHFDYPQERWIAEYTKAIGGKCPVLKLTLRAPDGQGVKGAPSANAISADRVDNTLGYVPGNVIFISFKANSLKSVLSLDEAQALVRYMSQHTS